MTSRKEEKRAKVGSKRDVYNGTAEKTKGGLRKKDLVKNKRGRVVSIKKSEAGKKSFRNNHVMKKHSQEVKRKALSLRA
jgi:hypothetical protein